MSEEKLVNLKINGIDVSVPEGTTVLLAARKAGIRIPTLCWLKDINEIGACRICVVENEVKGARKLIAACTFPVSEGMVIYTNSPKVIESRKTTLQLLLSNHKMECLSCVRSGNCELQALCKEYGVEDAHRFDGFRSTWAIDDSAPHMYRDNEKCILCRRCVAVCSKTQACSVIGANDRGIDTHIACAFERGLADVACVSCGQCIVACPTGALSEKDDTQKVFDALNDPKKHVIIQTAPSVRVQLGEEFGMPIGSLVTGKMVSSLRMLGFEKVFDTNFAADMTIMEEATEFLKRYKEKDNLPMTTSCSPGWVKYIEYYYPELLPHVSSTKSPQGIFGSIAKTYYAEKMGWDPADVFCVSAMPCTAKKFEAQRYEHTAVKGLPDIDAVLTTRELGRMIRKMGIMWDELPEGEFDAPFGLGSGAGTIFGATGGVMEAALRTAYEVVSGQKLPDDKLDFTAVRGTQGIKEADIDIPTPEGETLTIHVAVASGLVNAKQILEWIKSGEKNYDFVEIMACPGGCVNGGGQPIQPADVRNFTDIRKIRAEALYRDDLGLPIRRSHENPDVTAMYEGYFGEPGSEKAEEIMHTVYIPRKQY